MKLFTASFVFPKRFVGSYRLRVFGSALCIGIALRGTDSEHHDMLVREICCDSWANGALSNNWTSAFQNLQLRIKGRNCDYTLLST